MSGESSEKNTTVNQSGGITIEHADDVIVHSDMVGCDKINAGVSGTTLPPGGVPAPTASSAPPLELAPRFEKVSAAENAPLRVSASVPNTNVSFGPVDFQIPHPWDTTPFQATINSSRIL